jgi:small subunit ribosomal protein S6
MSRTKSSDIPHYELLCLFSNKFSETEVEPIRATVNKLIVDNGGKVTLEEYWGKRKLAYRVDGFRHGYYYLLEFDLEGPKLQEVNNRLRLSNEILRHQIIKKHKKTAAELVDDAKIAAKIAARHKAEEKAEIVANEKIKSEDETKTDLKNLDEELDKIIDSTNLL